MICSKCDGSMFKIGYVDDCAIMQCRSCGKTRLVEQMELFGAEEIESMRHDVASRTRQHIIERCTDDGIAFDGP